MINIQKITTDTCWIGGSDRRLAKFENLFPLTNGVSYNSYVIADEKTAVFDTADITIAEQYVENLAAALDGRALDYLVILHMEPDHCSQIARVASLYPGLTLVGNAKTFQMLGNFFPELAALPKVTVKEGDTLSLGSHTIKFTMAPMVHWPEVMLAYDLTTGALFTADAFGTFGALEGSVFADACDFETRYLDEARRYYANIVGKYGVQVQNVLKKLKNLDVRLICPLHGPVWRERLDWFIDKYQKWSTMTPEDDGIVLIYGSLYGHTASAAEVTARLIAEKSGKSVRVYDVSKTDGSVLIGEIWRVKKVVIFSPTYNNGVYLPIANLLHDLQALDVKNRVFAIGQNGSWAPAAAKGVAEALSTLKNCTILENVVTIKSALHEKDLPVLEAFAAAVAEA